MLSSKLHYRAFLKPTLVYVSVFGSQLASMCSFISIIENELQKERAEKQKLAEAKADAERSKTDAVAKYEDLCQSERRLREREQSNLQTLAQQRGLYL